MKRIIKILVWLLLLVITLMVLASLMIKADLRTAEIKQGVQSEAGISYAKSLLSRAIATQGMDKIDQFSTYEAIGTDEWAGPMGKMADPWGWGSAKTAMRFAVGDFDSQVEVLDGPQRGFIAGIQSWDYYTKTVDNYTSDIDDDEPKIFTLAAFHYFFELANRMADAPFIRYAGKGTLDGKAMDKVFVSWGNTISNYDHYIIYIGDKSGLIEAATFTTRDNPIPAPAFMFGSLRFDDYREIDGVLIPFVQTTQILHPKDDLNNHVHQFKLEQFAWDAFDVSLIRPFNEITPLGDNKPAANRHKEFVPAKNPLSH